MDETDNQLLWREKHSPAQQVGRLNPAWTKLVAKKKWREQLISAWWDAAEC
jgi:hypothetical protein